MVATLCSTSAFASGENFSPAYQSPSAWLYGTSANDKAAFSFGRGSGTPAIVRLYSPAKTRISSVKNKVQSTAAPSFNLA